MAKDATLGGRGIGSSVIAGMSRTCLLVAICILLRIIVIIEQLILRTCCESEVTAAVENIIKPAHTNQPSRAITVINKRLPFLLMDTYK